MQESVAEKPAEPGLWLYRAMLVVALAAYGVVLFFFLWGLSDGTVSSFNALPWLGLVALPGGIVWAALGLRRRGRVGLATLLLAIPALPALVFFVIMLVLIFTVPNWH